MTSSVQDKPLSWSVFWWMIANLQDHIEYLSDFQKSLENHFKTQVTKNIKDTKLVIETLEKVTEKSAISLELICAIWDYFRENLNMNFNDGLHGMELYMGQVSHQRLILLS